METNQDRPDRRRVEHTTLTPSQRSQRARLAALSRWGGTSKTERTAGTEKARETFRDSFPDDTAYRAHMARLAYGKSRTQQ